ncbi:MAG: hypothetical protein EZS28_000572 [Streblomastix strix]|uniref:Uncharacterized protein n=1 Tax=Streblomastix strix TaxID=222440 RepID=A0A5J4XAH0_9EUKA|nr:MAG: hypothetical protein EZS28_000572 [Streblomastix strix]
MLNIYIDERLLDQAGLSDFPELYANIKERYPKPIGELPQPEPIGEQTLQKKVKNNDYIIYGSSDGSSEVYELQLIVYSDRITLTASYATSGLFSNALNEALPEDVESRLDEIIINHQIQLS